MTNLFINGLSGKMGSSLKQVISKTKGISIVSSLVDSDVVIDFSRPESTIEILSQCEHNKLPIVIGTTGFNKEQIEKGKDKLRDSTQKMDAANKQLDKLTF